MRSNLGYHLEASCFSAALTCSIIFLSGCSPIASGDSNPANGIIGKPLNSASAMSDTTGADRTEVVLFDKTVRLIHHFDLTYSKVINTFTVDHPEASHSVLFDQNSGLIADFSDAHVTLFDRNGTRSTDVVALTGHPKSAALDSAHGILVVYDDMSTVGLIKFDANGVPQRGKPLGPVVQNDDTLIAGDLIDDGSLILALSSGAIAKVDVAQTLAQGTWALSSVATTLGHIKWLAPVHGYNDRVLVLTDQAFSLVSLADGSILAQHLLLAAETVAFESKLKDAHIIIQNGAQLSAVYTDGSAIRMKTLNYQTDLVLSSRLCLSEDSWALVTSKFGVSWTYAPNDIETTGRVLAKFSLANLTALKKLPLPDKAQLDVSATSVFALYPDSPLGYAENIGIQDGQITKIDKFNTGYIH